MNERVKKIIFISFMLIFTSIIIYLYFSQQNTLFSVPSEWLLFGLLVIMTILVFTSSFFKDLLNKEHLWILIFIIGLAGIITQRIKNPSYTFDQLINNDIWDFGIDFLKIVFISVLAKFFIDSVDKLTRADKQTSEAIQTADDVNNNIREMATEKLPELTKEFEKLTKETEQLQNINLSTNSITNFISKISLLEDKNNLIAKFKEFSNEWGKFLDTDSQNEKNFASHFIAKYFEEEIDDLNGKNTDSKRGLATNFNFYANLISSYYKRSKLFSDELDSHLVVFTLWGKPISKWFNYYKMEDDKIYCNRFFMEYKNSVKSFIKENNISLIRCLWKKEGIFDFDNYYYLNEEMKIQQFKEKYRNIYAGFDATNHKSRPNEELYSDLDSGYITPFVELYPPDDDEYVEKVQPGDYAFFNGYLSFAKDFTSKDKRLNKNLCLYQIGVPGTMDNEFLLGQADDFDFTMLGIVNEYDENKIISEQEIEWIGLINVNAWYDKEDLIYIQFMNKKYPDDDANNFKEYVFFVNSILKKIGNGSNESFGFIEDLIKIKEE